MKILVSWSSGKDSAWMLHVLRSERIGTPAALLTTINEAADRVAMHGVRTELLRLQAEAAGLPLIIVSIPSPCPNEVYEERMAAACRAAVADGFTHVAFGDLFLEDVRRYREERLAATGLAPLFPSVEPSHAGARARDDRRRPRGATDVRRSARGAGRARRPGVRCVAAGRPAVDRRSLRRARRVPHLRHCRAHVFATGSGRPGCGRRARRIRLCRPSCRTNRDAHGDRVLG